VSQGRAVTSKQIDKLLAGLRLGMTRRAAAAFAGFSKTTFYRMLREETDGTLVTLIENAEGEAEATYSALVAEAAVSPKNWTAAAWWLERRHPDEYGRRDRVEVTLDVKTLSAKIAAERGLDESEVMAEAERILAEAT
jgi:transposase